MTSFRSLGPPPCSTSIASRVSSALPTVRPSGDSIVVSTAVTCFFASLPTRTSELANARASSSVFMNAPRPTFTSSTRPSMPSASFLERIDAVMSGMDSTVAVTSRRA